MKSQTISRAKFISYFYLLGWQMLSPGPIIFFNPEQCFWSSKQCSLSSRANILYLPGYYSLSPGLLFFISRDIILQLPIKKFYLLGQCSLSPCQCSLFPGPMLIIYLANNSVLVDEVRDGPAEPCLSGLSGLTII